MAEFLTRRFACAHVDRGYGARSRRPVPLEAGPRGAACGPVSCSRFVRSRKYYTMYTAPVSQSVSYFTVPPQAAGGRRGAAWPVVAAPPRDLLSCTSFLGIFFPALLSGPSACDGASRVSEHFGGEVVASPYLPPIV